MASVNRSVPWAAALAPATEDAAGSVLATSKRGGRARESTGFADEAPESVSAGVDRLGAAPAEPPMIIPPVPMMEVVNRVEDEDGGCAAAAFMNLVRRNSGSHPSTRPTAFQSKLCSSTILCRVAVATWTVGGRLRGTWITTFIVVRPTIKQPISVRDNWREERGTVPTLAKQLRLATTTASIPLLTVIHQTITMTDRQTDKQTNRQTNKQTDRHVRCSCR